MRSDSRFSEASTLPLQQVDTPTVKLALNEEQGARVVADYRNVPMMSAYLPLQVGDTHWAVMAEIDQAGIDTGAARERPAMAGLLALFYGLSLLSLWYWQGRPVQEQEMQVARLDFGDVDGSGFGD